MDVKDEQILQVQKETCFVEDFETQHFADQQSFKIGTRSYIRKEVKES